MAPAASLILTVLALTVLAVHGSVYVRERCPYSSDGHSISHHTCNDTGPGYSGCPYGETCCGTRGGGSVCRYIGCDAYHRGHTCQDGYTCRSYTPPYCPSASIYQCRTPTCEIQPRECPPLRYMPGVHTVRCNQSLSHMQCPHGEYCCATYNGGAMCMPRDPCYNKVCSPGKMCQPQGPPGSAIAQCVDDPCTLYGSCPPGQHCETSLSYTCPSPPCPPATHRCVPSSPCSSVQCQPGYECRLEMVFCITAPCPPIARCVPIAPSLCNFHPPCPPGERCEVVPINCLVPPCPPGVATCVQSDFNLCAAVTCHVDTPCNRRTGQCEPLHPCALVLCGPGMICNDRSGECEPNRCLTVRCSTGYTCNPQNGNCEPDHPCALVLCGPGMNCNPQTGRCESSSTHGTCPPINRTPHHRASECNVRNPLTCPSHQVCCLNAAAGTMCVERARSECPPPHLLPNVVTLTCLESGEGYEKKDHQLCCQTQLGGAVWTNPASEHCNDHQRCPSTYQYCRNGQCWPNNCANYPCPPGHSCDHQHGQCVPYDVNTCPPPGPGVCITTCGVRNRCIPGTICCPTGCGGMTCVTPVTQDPCSLVLCRPGFRCNRTGNCEPITNMCGTQHCPPGTQCDWTRGRCEPVVPGQCPPPGDFGTCAVTCRRDQYGPTNGPPSCTNGRICCGTACGGTTCVYPDNTNICAGVQCRRGHHCHPAHGTCVPDPNDLCATVRCQSGTYCKNGQCIPMCGKDKYGQMMQPAGTCGTARVNGHYVDTYCREDWMCVTNHYMGGKYCCPLPIKHKKSTATSNTPSILLGIPLAVLLSKVFGYY